MALKDHSLEAPEDDSPPENMMPALDVAGSMNDLNLESEILTQVAHVRRLRDHIATDKSTPANQKAQVNNSCTALLAQLVKMQETVYNIERVKKLEAVLIKCLQKLPDHVVGEFLDEYDQALRDVH